MKFILNCSKALERVLRRTSDLKLERLVEPDAARPGTQSLHSSPYSLSWQCQYYSTRHQSDSGHVIMVEAWSRYAMILPFPDLPVREELEFVIQLRWAEEMRLWHSISNQRQHTLPIAPSIEHSLPINEFSWVLNTDLSVAGHVSDTEQWARQEIHDHRGRPLSENEAMELGAYINDSPRKATASRRQSDYFIPFERILVLLSSDYAGSVEKLAAMPKMEIPDNVVSFEAFKKRRSAAE